jgi:hypothetical protein
MTGLEKMKTKIILSFTSAVDPADFFQSSAQAQALPAPQVQFGGTEDYETEGKQWTRYKLGVRRVPKLCPRRGLKLMPRSSQLIIGGDVK